MKTLLLLCLALSPLTFAQSPNSTAAELDKLAARFAPVDLKVDISGLSAGDKAAIKKLLQAAEIIDALQLQQRWSGNKVLWPKLSQDGSPLGRARYRYFWLNKGPWSIIDDNKAFMPGVPDKKPEGANFYPEDATKEQLESWMKGLPEKERNDAQWFFTVIRKDDKGNFRIVPYSEEYKADLEKLSALLKEAANETQNASLKKFLNGRADAFLSNDYYDSDLAWMDLDSDLDITIGPYETYNDDLFGFKAAFEAYVNVRDAKETGKLKLFGQHLQEIENNLPLDDKYKNKQVGAVAPMVVVNEVMGAGDGNMGVQTAAYNLPNDERVISQRGSKRIMLKNVQQAKFAKTLTPISKLVLRPEDQKDLDFDSFFTHILMHEVTHGLGPHALDLNGRKSTPRQELKDAYGTIEEAKADITGLFALQYLMEKGILKSSLGQGEAAERKLYNTFLASTFRTLHFGLTDSHARGMAIQFNYLTDKGGFVSHGDGTYSIDFAKIKQAVTDLDREFLTIEATGDYDRAKKLMKDLIVIRPDMQKALDKMKGVPNDIRPNFVTANALMHPAAGPAKGKSKK
jgi:Peptidase family M49